MLRCSGCGVMHHPGCWVTNGGCATQREHESTPAALAYSRAERRPGEPARHPSEGTQVREPAGDTTPLVIGEAEPLAEAPNPAQPPAVTPTRMARQRGPDPTEVIMTPPRAPRRYVPNPGERHPATGPLPKIYGHHRLLGYWYVPAAVLVAIGVALGVIWGAEQLFGSSNSSPADPTPAVSATAPAAATTATTAAPSATTTATAVTGTPTPTVVATATGKFRAGDVVTVTGTGECLNVRVAPGRDNDAIVCLQDGNTVTITGGPETAGDLRWWKVKTQLGEGWAAEDYLVKR